MMSKKAHQNHDIMPTAFHGWRSTNKSIANVNKQYSPPAQPNMNPPYVHVKDEGEFQKYLAMGYEEVVFYPLEMDDDSDWEEEVSTNLPKEEPIHPKDPKIGHDGKKSRPVRKPFRKPWVRKDLQHYPKYGYNAGISNEQDKGARVHYGNDTRKEEYRPRRYRGGWNNGARFDRSSNQNNWKNEENQGQKRYRQNRGNNRYRP